MKSKTLMVLFCALGFGVLAAVGIVNALGNDKGAVVEETLPVLVVDDFLDIQTPLTEENCHVDYWPAKLVPQGVVSDLKDIEGMFNKTRLSKGLPVMLEQIAKQAFFDRDMIPPGHKVVAIKVREDDTISGLLKPGQQVDVIGVVDAPDVNGRSSRLKVAKTFLKGIRVYSVNGERDGSASSEEKGRRGDAIVGVLVNEKQSEQIVLVQRVGNLKLVLRAKTDNITPESNPDFNQLFAGIISDPSASSRNDQSSRSYDREPEQQVQAPSFVMKVYNGNEAMTHQFDAEGRKLTNQNGGGSGYRSFGGGSSKKRSSSAGSSNRGEFETGEEYGESAEFEDSFEEDQYLGE